MRVAIWTAIILGLLLAWTQVVFATSSGAQDCSGTANSSAAESPWSDDDWESGVANACVDNGTYTHVSSNTYDKNDQSYVLYVKDFGFSISGTIDGITVTLNTWSSTSTHQIDLCQLLDENGVRGGTNLCSSPVVIDSIADTNIETLGSTSEKWGNALTDTWINDPDFGVALGILGKNNNANVFIDYIQITVEYTTGGTPASRERMIMQ